MTYLYGANQSIILVQGSFNEIYRSCGKGQEFAEIRRPSGYGQYGKFAGEHPGIRSNREAALDGYYSILSSQVLPSPDRLYSKKSSGRLTSIRFGLFCRQK